MVGFFPCLKQLSSLRERLRILYARYLLFILLVFASYAMGETPFLLRLSVSVVRGSRVRLPG